MATETARRSTILLVDDDPSTLLLASKPLQDHGYTVLKAPGSAEALRLYAEHPTPIHLVVTDIFLPPPGFQLSVEKNPYPRVNGLEMVDRLLENKRDIRIILMSSTPGADLHSRGLIREEFPVLKKPFTGEALLMLVQQTLAGPPAAPAPTKSSSTDKGDVEWVD